jgi:xanthine dehydrogenase accessory factor
MLVWPDGRIQGTVGGATLEERVIEDALEGLESRKSQLNTYVFSTTDDPASVGLCGGEVEVHIEVIEPQATLYILGAGHVAMPLAVIGKEIGMRVVVVDDRDAYATEERFPGVDELQVVAYDEGQEVLAPLPVPLSPPCYVVVATWGWDEPALMQILQNKPIPEYVGLVASPTKARVIEERLKEAGLPEDIVSQVRAPIGLDLGAETPGEIALAIAAEILKERRRASGLSMLQKHINQGKKNH